MTGSPAEAGLSGSTADEVANALTLTLSQREREKDKAGSDK